MILDELGFDEPDFTLRWPRELFIFEAKQLLKRPDFEGFPQRVSALCAEAFIDSDVERTLDNAFFGGWGKEQEHRQRAAAFLQKLIDEPQRLHGYTRRKYYNERHFSSRSTPQLNTPLATSFLKLIQEMSRSGYFPDVLPKECVDDLSTHDVDPSDVISRAIGVDVSWPEDLDENRLFDHLLYSIIEFFHDKAQRPRRYTFHNFSNCGNDYFDYSKFSGSVVYRWRVNEMLEQHGIELRLGNDGPETGFLIKRSALPMEGLADQVVDEVPEGDHDHKEKLQSAIRAYRRRDADIHDRRKAISHLADILERHRNEFKKVQRFKKDEQDLFNMYNNFMIRHERDGQKDDYPEEYLDWIFWTSLAAIQLVHKLGVETAKSAES